MTRKTKADRKQQMTRIICLTLAALMIGSVVLGAIIAAFFANDGAALLKSVGQKDGQRHTRAPRLIEKCILQSCS